MEGTVSQADNTPEDDGLAAFPGLGPELVAVLREVGDVELRVRLADAITDYGFERYTNGNTDGAYYAAMP